MPEPVATRTAATSLSARILDPGRTHHIVGVSRQAWRDECLVDLDRLRARLGDHVEICVVLTGDATWELKRSLPAGLDVYGDAVRVWPPGTDALSDPDAPEPLGGVVVLDGDDTEQALGLIADLVGEPAREEAAVVVEVRPDRATLRLVDGTQMQVPRSRITRHDLAATQVVRAAQTLRVMVYPRTRDSRTRTGSLVPFEPDARTRMVQSYGVGSALLGRVTREHPYGAIVELLPGVTGLLPTDQLGGAGPSGSGDGSGSATTRGALVSVRVAAIDGTRIRLSSYDGTTEAARLHPDGPSWLGPLVATELPGLDLASAGLDEGWGPTSDHPHDDVHPIELEQLGQLENLVSQATDAHAQSRHMIEQAAHQVVRLRSEADRLRHELELDLVEFRDRVLQSVEAEYDELEGSTTAALEASRAEVARLRELLAASEAERDRLRDRLHRSAEVSRDQRADLRQARADASRQQARVRRLDAELKAFVPVADRLRVAIRQSWLQRSTKTDRERFPWRDPVIGPAFAGSLAALEGVSRERVIEVCAEVVSGRAVTRSGLQVHPLRAGRGGSSAQRIRDDGARAYRASLQVRSSSARRLHYWALSDGRVELAKVGYHDDFSI